MIKTNLLVDHFLVAMPGLNDSSFAKSVVYIYEHDNEGALGMVINKPLQINLGNVLEHLGITLGNKKIVNHPVLMGGPVGQESGFIMYPPKEKQAHKQLLVSASREMLDDIARDHGPEHFIVALGYAGWQANQLEQEVARNDWLIVPYNHRILFNTPMEKRWQATVALIGIDVTHLSNQVGHA